MTVWDFTAAVYAGSLVAGALGSLTGLGGGVVLIPLLTLGFGVDIRYAMGASLVSVIATSSGAAAAYVKEGYSNIRIGMFLEVATTLGAVGGAHLTTLLPTPVIAVVLGLVLIGSGVFSGKPGTTGHHDVAPDRLARLLRMNGSFPESGRLRAYDVTHVPLGFALMLLAGGFSGLLGIGSGAMKVLAMDRAMKIPFKVSTTTSNFMIGVTAAASAGVYLRRGYIDPGLAMPVMLGVLTGSVAGSRILTKAKSGWLRLLFSLVIVGLGIEMIFDALHGNP